jgi:hypothetical protein
MYYRNQIAEHVKKKQDEDQKNGVDHAGLRFHKNVEECDYVIRCHDAYYDIGLIFNKAGELVPFFDDYDRASFNVPETNTGHGPIRQFLGAQFAGKVEHWSGQREAGEQQLHSVGQLMQQYSIAQTCEQAAAEGMMISHTTTDEEGNVHLHLLVQ